MANLSLAVAVVWRRRGRVSGPSCTRPFGQEPLEEAARASLFSELVRELA